MKTKQNNTLVVVIILAALITFSSCKKEQVVSPVKKTTDIAAATETYNMMLKATMSLGGSGVFKTEDADAVPGAIVTIDTLSNPHTKTIDYGSGCMGNDGKVYKGQMVLTYTSNDFLHDNGGYVTVTPTGYSVNDNAISGTSTLQNNGINGNGNISYTYGIDAKRVSLSGVTTDSIGGQQTVEWVAGSGTSDKTDDQFSFTGAMSGVLMNEGSVNFTISILDALILNRVPGCNQFYVAGETLTQMAGQSDRYLDYGDGTCDDLATETIDGQSTIITLE